MSDNAMEKRRGYGLLVMGVGALGWLAYRQSAAGKRAIAADRADEELPMPLAYQQAEDTILPLLLVGMAGLGVGGGLYTLHLANKAEGGSTEGLEDLTADTDSLGSEYLASYFTSVKEERNKAPERCAQIFNAMYREAYSSGKKFVEANANSQPNFALEDAEAKKSWKNSKARREFSIYLAPNSREVYYTGEWVSVVSTIYQYIFHMGVTKAQANESGYSSVVPKWADLSIKFLKGVKEYDRSVGSTKKKITR